MVPNSGLIDRYISYPLANCFVDVAYNIGLTPNIITTITLIIRIYIAYLIYKKKNYELIILLYILSWLTDVIDGTLARKYNMTSDFGEKYDYYVDWITHVIMNIALLSVLTQTMAIESIFTTLALGLSGLCILLYGLALKSKCSNGSKEWEIYFASTILDNYGCGSILIDKLDPGTLYVYQILAWIYIFYYI